MKIMLLFLVAELTTLLGVEPRRVVLPSEMAPFVPSGWQAIAWAGGDLNGDGRYDFALAMDDLSFIKPQDFYEKSPYLESPARVLVIYLGGSKGYVPFGRYQCLPYDYYFSGMTIAQGLLRIKTMCCGFEGFFQSKEEYKYRFEQDRFRLIGADMHYYSRIDDNHCSVNLLTSQVKFTERRTDKEGPDAVGLSWEVFLRPLVLYLEDAPLVCFYGLTIPER